MNEIEKLLEEIMEHQMNHVELARTTVPYKLAEKALNKLRESKAENLPISGVSHLFIDEEVNQAAIDYAAVDDDNVKKGSYDIREKQAFVAGVLYVIKRANNR